LVTRTFNVARQWPAYARAYLGQLVYCHVHSAKLRLVERVVPRPELVSALNLPHVYKYTVTLGVIDVRDILVLILIIYSYCGGG